MKLMRTAFSRFLVDAARADPRIVLLTGDHGYALFDEFRRACPGQYINAGVAEQNMVGVAAGLAKGGFRPVVYGLSAFVPVRVLEQIKLDVCHEGLPIVFIGDGAGVVYGQLGVSHQSTEDIATLRAVPGIAILSPADAHEMNACMHLALAVSGPVYLRIGKADLGPVHSTPPRLAWGKMVRIHAGRGPLAWIATGSMLSAALSTSRHWPGSSVWSAPFVKPLDEVQVAATCRRHRAIIVLEEHSVHGGLGSAVAEIACEHCPMPICRIGIEDRFSQHCGSYAYLLKEHGLDAEAIVRRVTRFLEASSHFKLSQGNDRCIEFPPASARIA
jgi:transketolase